MKNNSTQTLPQLLAAIAQHFSYADVLEKLQVLSEREQEDSKVDLVVLGRFKAGKSSLINSILQKNLLPAGVLPVTAIITRIAYDIREKAVVTDIAGRSFEIPVHRLHEFVSESNNPNNKKEVALVDLFTPSLSSFKNIRIIDTPGLGSAFQHNSRVTRQWYSRIGAALVVMNSTQTCSEEDRKLIAAALENSPLLFLVLSKIDLLNENEIHEVIHFVKRRNKEHLKQELEPLLYSKFSDETRYRQILINKILEPLNNSHNAAIHSIRAHKLKQLKKRTLSYLNITLTVRQKEANERHDLREKIIGEQLKLNQIKQELRLIAENYKENTRKILGKKIVDAYKKELTQQLITSLEQNRSISTGNLNAVSRKYEQWLKEAMYNNLYRIETKVRQEANQLAASAGIHITNYCNAFGSRLNHNLQRVLGVTMPEDSFVMRPAPVEHPDIRTSWAFESHIDLIWFLVPMFLFKNTVMNHFKKQLPSEAEKNLYRLTAQLSRNVNHIIDLMHTKAVNYITEQLSTIEYLLTQQGTGTDEVKNYLTLLDKTS